VGADVIRVWVRTCVGMNGLLFEPRRFLLIRLLLLVECGGKRPGTSCVVLAHALLISRLLCATSPLCAAGQVHVLLLFPAVPPTDVGVHSRIKLLDFAVKAL
jgi:hypothetical protein